MSFALTSLTLAGTELLDAGTYWVAQETYFSLVAATEQAPRLVDMAGRHPAYVGQTPQQRSIPLLVLLQDPSASQRMTDFAALEALVQTAGLIALAWTENAVTKRYWVHVETAIPSEYMTRAALACVAPNPVAEVI